MSERSDLLASIANTITPYRAGEIATPTPTHVDRWVSQFTTSQQLPFLREFAHVIAESFITREQVIAFLTNLVTNEKLAGASPVNFWSNVNFLRVQQNGLSQIEMLELFGNCLEETLGLSIENCGAPAGDYVYLDDIMCTGSRVGSDLTAWIAEDAPDKSTLHVILAVTHTSSNYYVQSVRIKKAIADSRKTIKVKFWHALEVENQKAHRNNSGVLWPVALDEESEALQEYAASQRFPFVARSPGGTYPFFSSEEGRQVLESEFLTAGMTIRSQHSAPKEVLKPLGYGGFGIGFGSTLVTYRNCPNTAPLALWWGEGAETGALQWYPLLPRQTYSSAANVFRNLTR